MLNHLENVLGAPLSTILRTTILLFIPWFLLVFLGYFAIPFKEDYAKELIGFALFTTLFWSLIWLFKARLWRFWLGLISCVVLFFFLYFKITFYWEYDHKVSTSALFVIFETNGEEASDFLSNYLDAKAIVLLLLGIVFIVMAYRQWRRNTLFLEAKKSKGVLNMLRIFGLLSLLFLCAYGISWKFPEENIPYTVATSFNEYWDTKTLLKDQLATSKGYDYQVQPDSVSEQNLVVVIGESTSRWHMQLYGYERATNPRLTEIKDQLLVFDSVISPHVHTITALDKILTLHHARQPKIAKNVSVVQLANQAGYETYWLSNQRAVGVFESIPTLIGSAADHTYFLNGNAYNDRAHDGILLPKFGALLKEGPLKKMIFVHLMGTHIGYDKRYPKEFDVFKDRLNEDPTKADFINHYDNSTLYNDHIVRSLIDSLAQYPVRSKLLYFSDHGDDVFDEMDGIGHNEYKATRPMYEVPLIIWQSDVAADSLSKNNNLLGRKYNLEDFAHTFGDFARLRFNGFDPKRSVINIQFEPLPRIIKDSVDYDSR